MSRTEFTSSLREIASEYDAVSQSLFELAGIMDRAPRYDPKERLYSLVRCAELNTIALRNVTARTMRGSVSSFYEDLASVMGISVQEERKWIRITVPASLPNRGNRDNSEFLTRPLRNSLIQFQREHTIARFRDCMICIVHGYDEALSLRRVRDYDNIETKRYLDVIASVLLTDDSGLLCSVLQTTQVAEMDCTEFYLMQPETLQQWAAAHIKSKR